MSFHIPRAGDGSGPFTPTSQARLTSRQLVKFIMCIAGEAHAGLITSCRAGNRRIDWPCCDMLQWVAVRCGAVWWRCVDNSCDPPNIIVEINDRSPSNHHSALRFHGGLTGRDS